MSGIHKMKNPSVEDGLVSEAMNRKKSTPTRHKIKMAIKRLIVKLAVWGLIPANIATWLIGVGGLRHE